jgi:hypothetical protein
MSGDDAAHEPPTGSSSGTPAETDVSAVETLGSVDDRDRRRALVRDVGLLSLVAASPVFQLVSAGRVTWSTLAVAAVAVAALGAGVVVWRPFAALDDLHRQLLALATTTVCVACVVVVLEPAEVSFASASVGSLVGAFVARLAGAVGVGTTTDDA